MNLGLSEARWIKPGRRAAIRVGEFLHRTATTVLHLARRQRAPLPTLVTVNGRSIDIVDDMAAFTGLDRAVIVREITTRRHLSHLLEWHATPREFRQDHWFYLSSKGYLFSNAGHFTDGGIVRASLPYVGKGPVLEFGGGTGQVSVMLAAAGIPSMFVELNALQVSFVRFRVHRHGLPVRVLDAWEPLPVGEFSAVMAFDVLEHLPDAARTLEERLLPSLRPTGVLIENSPFGAGIGNPMHHEDFGFESFMARRGFAPTPLGDLVRAWLPATARSAEPADSSIPPASA